MSISINVEAPEWELVRALRPTVRRALAAALPANEKRGISIVFVDDETIRELNKSYRKKNKPTNVLSFPAGDVQVPRGEVKPLGEVVLAYGVIAQEAKEQKKKLRHHISHLIVHGVLHLLGYDHEKDAEAEKMERKERAILEELGIPDPYET